MINFIQPLLAENLYLHIEGDLQLDEEDLLEESPILLPVVLQFVVEILLIDVLTLHLQDGDLHLHQEEGVHPLHRGVTGHHLGLFLFCFILLWWMGLFELFLTTFLIGALLEEFVEVLFEDVLLLLLQGDGNLTYCFTNDILEFVLNLSYWFLNIFQFAKF